MLLNRTNSGSKWHVRPDGKGKVTGGLKYLTDMTAEGMLYGKVLRTEHPSAILLSIDVTEAEALEGVQAVITHKDVPGMNLFGIATPDQPVLCHDRVRYCGDAIAAIAADTLEIATRALALIKVEYEVLTPIDSPEAALDPEADKLHPDGNVLHRTEIKRGNVEEGFAGAVYVVKEEYKTPRQMHGYMETEGGLFVPGADGRLTVYAPTQHGYKDRMQLSRILAIPEEQIRVVSSPIGGSFGGKDELNVQPYGSLLALKTGCPVKMHNSRWESVQAGLKRHPMKIVMETGMDEHGIIVAHRARITADTGAYATLGAAVLQFATEHAMGPYSVSNLDVEGISVYTNNGVSGEFRGFGGNQVIFGMEGQMDRLAEMIGLDRWEIRRRNLRSSTERGPQGQRILTTDGLHQVWETMDENSVWQKRHQPHQSTSVPWIKRGVGAGISMHGSGLGYGLPDPMAGRLGLNKEGKIEAAFSFEEVGQGLITSLEIMLLDLFQCRALDLNIILGDTDRAPHSGSTTASRATTMSWMALQRLKTPFTQKLLGLASELTGIPADQLKTGPGGVWLKEIDYGESDELKSPLVTYIQIAQHASEELLCDTAFDYPTSPDQIYGCHFLYSYASVAVEVEVNTLTGEVKLLDTRHVVAAGPIINPMGFIGQIEGGSAMAMGFTLMEDAAMSGSRYLTRNLDTYMLPTIKDAQPSLEVNAIEELPEGDPYGPRGIGEIGSAVLAPAIVGAIHDATGIWVSKLPVPRELLIQKLKLPEHEGVMSS